MAVVAVVSLETGRSVHLAGYPVDAQGLFVVPKTITWSSSAPAVATVTSDGVVTGVSPGTATITVMGNPGGLASDVTILVGANPAVGMSVAVGNRE